MNTPTKLNRWIVWPAVAVLVAVVLVACGGGEQETVTTEERASPVAAAALGQAITWTPASITDTISPGGQQSIPVAFTASSNLQNVAVNVVPALQGLVQVNPSSFASVQKGQVVTVTLAVSAATSAPLALTQGTIQLRVKNATVAQPLPVQIIVASGAIGLLPPDPGSAGMATLAGIDSNNDGVRDDIERYIWLTYPQSAKVRAALRQLAIADQTLVVGSGTPQSNQEQLLAALDCRSFTFMSGPTDTDGGLRSRDIGRALTAIILNTPSRVKAYAQSNDQFSGSAISITPFTQRAVHCATAPSSFPN